MLDFCIELVASILTWILIAQALLSWFAGPQGGGGARGVISSIYNGITSLTHPLTSPARALLRKFNTGPIDFSILLTVLFIIIIRETLIRLI